MTAKTDRSGKAVCSRCSTESAEAQVKSQTVHIGDRTQITEGITYRSDDCTALFDIITITVYLQHNHISVTITCSNTADTTHISTATR